MEQGSTNNYILRNELMRSAKGRGNQKYASGQEVVPAGLLIKYTITPVVNHGYYHR